MLIRCNRAQVRPASTVRSLDIRRVSRSSPRFRVPLVQCKIPARTLLEQGGRRCRTQPSVDPPHEHRIPCTDDYRDLATVEDSSSDDTTDKNDHLRSRAQRGRRHCLSTNGTLSSANGLLGSLDQRLPIEAPDPLHFQLAFPSPASSGKAFSTAYRPSTAGTQRSRSGSSTLERLPAGSVQTARHFRPWSSNTWPGLSGCPVLIVVLWTRPFAYSSTIGVSITLVTAGEPAVAGHQRSAGASRPSRRMRRQHQPQPACREMTSSPQLSARNRDSLRANDKRTRPGATTAHSPGPSPPRFACSQMLERRHHVERLRKHRLVVRPHVRPYPGRM